MSVSNAVFACGALLVMAHQVIAQPVPTEPNWTVENVFSVSEPSRLTNLVWDSTTGAISSTNWLKVEVRSNR